MSQRSVKSASLRLTVLIAGVMVLVSLGGLWFQYAQVARAFDARQIEALQADLDGYSALYDQRRIPALRQAMAFRAETQTGYDRVFLLLDKQHTFLGGNISTWPDGVETTAKSFTADPVQWFDYTLPNGRRSAYMGVARDLPGGFPILVATSLAQREALMADMRVTIGWAVVAMIALSMAAGWLVSRLVITRIDRVNRLADRVATGELGARIPGARSDDEFGRLEAHVHDMLDRIESLQNATARLSDNIAHELRTPLNRIRQELDQVQGQEEVVAALKGELSDTVRVFEALLDIASAEAATGDKPGLVPVNLSELCVQIFEFYEPMGEDQARAMTANIAPDLWVLGDRSLISQLLANLLDNALKFTAPGDLVTLTLSHSDNRHCLTVSDTGPGVSDDIRNRLFNQFERGTPAHGATGHGLGLALVRAISARHGAKLRILPQNKGFAVESLWPKVDPM
ncbi:ATP-binding protein [Shimia abyssi]|uniref:histidine kinase n=1 Tax=Shimia abyssi TaxID=1662395 RepID=A0A2P8FBV3_9RHOB|nr:ATP-binding protein [Shimia abyssi]PSL19189.1 signal transduction histidine kinase [Shimia abyssi]